MAEQCKGSTSLVAEPEDMTTFLNQVLLHSSSTSSSKFVNPNAFSSPPLTMADVSTVSHFPDRRRHGVGGHPVAGVYDASGGCKYPGDNGVLKWRCNENDVADYHSGGKTEKGTVEGASDAVRTRSSSKRSRAAEVHNLSEKRRRSRINEKMKALQKLIPNSNKTDKASMLDEAIEYLKQLQLQVQMLTLRNGMTLHPMSLPGLHLMQFPIPATSIDEGSSGLFNATNMVTASFSANEESLVQTILNLPNQFSVSNQPITMLSGRNMNVPETTFSYEQLTQLHNQPCNLSTAAKEICREGPPHARLDQTMNTSSSSVS